MKYNVHQARTWLVLLVTFMCILKFGNAAVFKGKVFDSKDSGNFIYLGKFCFDYTVGDKYHLPGGAVDIEITPLDPTKPVELNDMQVWMFDDEASSWPSLQYKELSCQERFQRARGAFMVVPDEEQQIKHGVWRYNRTFDISQHLRPRHWWFVLASCKGEFTNLQWKLHAYNLHTPPTLREFSVDEKHLTIIFRISLLLFVILLVTHVYGIRRYYMKAKNTSETSYLSSPSSHTTQEEESGYVDYDIDEDMVNAKLASHSSRRSTLRSEEVKQPVAPSYFNFTPQIIQLFTISLSLAVICHWGHFMHSHFFAIDGEGIWWLDRVSNAIDVVARVQLTMVIMLVSSGWAVGHNQNEHSRRTILILLGLFGSIYLAMAVIKAVLQDSQYTRVTPVIALVLDMVTIGWTFLAIWFLRTIYKTYVHETSRANIAETLFPNSNYSQKILNAAIPPSTKISTDGEALPSNADAIVEAERKRRHKLYLTLAILYTFWLLCEPLLVYLQRFLKPWTRTEIMAAVSSATTLVAYGWFVWAFWPSHDGEYMMLYGSVQVPNANKKLLQDDDDDGL